MLNEEERLNTEISCIKAILNIQQVYNRIFDYPEFVALFKNQTIKTYARIIREFVLSGKRPTSSDVLIKCTKEEKKIFTEKIYKCEDFRDIDYFEILTYDNIENELQDFIKLNHKQYTGKQRIENFRDGVLDIFSPIQNKIKIKDNPELVDSVLQEIKDIRAGKVQKYVSTGYTAIDNFIGGFVKGGITLIGARPSQGKTTFMLNLKNRLNIQGYNCVVFSVEMKAEDLVYKDLSYLSKINSLRIESGHISDSEMLKIEEVSKKLKTDNYFYIDESRQTADKIVFYVKQLSLKKKIDVVFLDYLTLLDVGRDRSKNEAVEETMAKLRQFAKESNIALVILSQLNRAVEQRADKKPILADLRDSGSIEQDANQVLFLYRPAYYFPELEVTDIVYSNNEQVGKDNLLNVIIAKCRGGKTGDVYLEYLKEIHTINNTENIKFEEGIF